MPAHRPASPEIGSIPPPPQKRSFVEAVVDEALEPHLLPGVEEVGVPRVDTAGAELHRSLRSSDPPTCPPGPRTALRLRIGFRVLGRPERGGRGMCPRDVRGSRRVAARLALPIDTEGGWILVRSGECGPGTCGDAGAGGGVRRDRRRPRVRCPGLAGRRRRGGGRDLLLPVVRNRAADGAWQHWQQNDNAPPLEIASDCFPARGPYSSDDRGVVRSQMREIAGIGVRP